MGRRNKKDIYGIYDYCEDICKQFKSIRHYNEKGCLDEQIIYNGQNGWNYKNVTHKHHVFYAENVSVHNATNQEDYIK